MRKSAREKLRDDKGLPTVVKLEGDAQKRWGGRTMVIAAPRQVDAAMRRIAPGTTVTLSELRGQLAQAAGAEIACPLTTGIFARLAAEAAEEDAAEGKTVITPWWRVLTSDGRPNPKFPGGGVEQCRRLALEGLVLHLARPRRSRPTKAARGGHRKSALILPGGGCRRSDSGEIRPRSPGIFQLPFPREMRFTLRNHEEARLG